VDPAAFAHAMLHWYARHGRRDLPWKAGRDPYPIWVAEIMLQQTQVRTVIPYFARFIARFPTVTALADAPLDAVLARWSGLGYYARARNLHQAACLVRDRHGGSLPRDRDALEALPGIGRSTAGAILAMAFDQRQPILDGNVKRVLARYHTVDGWPGQKRVADRLWALAERYTPPARVADYTQAIMDLGATVCTRKRPLCHGCPVARGCRAHGEQRTEAFPAPRPRRTVPVRTTAMVVLQNERGQVLLERRPPTGIWGGLWSFPECPPEGDLREWLTDRLACTASEIARWPPFRHTFSHFHLDITPIHCRVAAMADRIAEGDTMRWYRAGARPPGGLAAPVQRLIATLEKTTGETNGPHRHLRPPGKRG
jgi:A/G-specific adenine glycosylase